MRRLPLIAVSGGYSSLQCTGFSWALGVRASIVVACGLSSCGMPAAESVTVGSV